jgi:predicted DNA-binding transcriptional regulator YafY
MNFIEKEKRINYIIELLEKGKLLSAKEMASKFSCSERTIFRLLEIVKEKGVDVNFCKIKRIYKVTDKNCH